MNLTRVRLTICLTAVVFAFGCHHHPRPAATATAPVTRDMYYVTESTTNLAKDVELLEVLGKPPEAGSAEELSELREIAKLQKPYLQPDSDHDLDLKDAQFEAEGLWHEDTRFAYFTTRLIEHLKAEGYYANPVRLAATRDFLNKAMHDFGAGAAALKNVHPHPRPGWKEMTEMAAASGISITNFAKIMKSNSYPSAHESLGHGMALVLSLLDPASSSKYEAEGEKIGLHREILAAHFPSDVKAGRRVSEWLFAQMITSPEFQKDYKAALAEVAVIIRPENKVGINQ